jgi:amino acid permease
MLHSLSGHGYAPAVFGRLSTSGAPRNALAMSTAGLAIAAIVSVKAADSAYVALFGISVFGALVVWLMILASHFRFRFAYVVVSRRSRAETNDPLREELAARQSTPAPGPTRDPDLVPDV